MSVTFKILIAFALFFKVNSEILKTSFNNTINTTESFNKWAIKHGKKFKDEKSLSHVYSTWLSNDEYINTINSQNLSFQLGHNEFSGLNITEFSDLMGFNNNAKELKPKEPKDPKDPKSLNLRRRLTLEEEFEEKKFEERELATLPTSVDWRTSGAVTPVKNQGTCGSCWAFSSTGALEGAYKIKYGTLVSFSEQQLVDCDNANLYSINGGLNNGCSGGGMIGTLQWIGIYGGICNGTTYPYVSDTTNTAGTCKSTCSKVSGSIVKSTTTLITKSDTVLMTAIAQQPVSVSVDASSINFQLYKSGVLTTTCKTTLNHGVLAVGYGTLNNVNYYIVKNSWGTTWGNAGYILIGRGNDPSTNLPYNSGSGQCGILMYEVYPNL